MFGMHFVSMLMTFIVAMMAVFVVIWPKPGRVIGEATFLCGSFTAREDFLNQVAV